MLELIHHDGDIWAVIGHGALRDDGLQYCHLASTTRFVQQRNGKRAIQIGDWINPQDIELEFTN